MANIRQEEALSFLKDNTFTFIRLLLRGPDVIFKRLFFLFAFVSLPLFADVESISVEKLESLRDSGVHIIDIRTPVEWEQTGIIEKSYTIMFFDPQGRYDLNNFLKKLAALGIDNSTPFVLVCRTGNRTKSLGDFLSNELGYKKVYDLKGGIVHWKRLKKPVVNINSD